MKKKVLSISIIIIVFIITSFISLAYSTYISSKYNTLLTKQITWNIISIIVLFILLMNKNNIFKYSKVLYLINLILLIIPLISNNEINGIKAWISFGFISFQPSELMKISLSIMLADYLVNSKKKDYVKIIVSLIITLIPSILTFIEPDTGSVIVYFVILLFMMIFNNIKRIYFIILTFIILLFLSIFIYFYINNVDVLIDLFGTNIFYRIDRIINFTNNSNLQLNNALISIGSSNILNLDINNTIIYFPEAPTDFIFALLIHIFGYGYGVFIIILYFMLDIIIIKTIKKEKSNKMSLLLMGLFGAFLYQQIQNILMNIGLLPIVGLTLPFISYGGSSLIVYYIFISFVIKSIINKNYL